MLLPWGSHVYQSSWFAGLMSRCHHHLSKLMGNASRSTASDVPTPGDSQVAGLPRYSYDASLLFRRMALLQIDRDELAKDEPLLLRELQGFCTLCTPKQQCLRDLEWECKTGEPQDWREYCPNAATLNALGALQNCPWAAQYIKMPHASKRSVPNDGEGHG